MTEPESAVLNRYTTENVFASGDGNRHGCCTHLLKRRDRRRANGGLGFPMPVSAAVAAGGWGKVTKPQHVRGYRATRSGTHGLPPARRNADWVLPLSGRIFGTQSARPVWDIARFPARTRLLVGCSARRRTELGKWRQTTRGQSLSCQIERIVTVESARKNAVLVVLFKASQPIKRAVHPFGDNNRLL